MTIKVFVFVENGVVKCYHNLRQLCDDNSNIHYYTARRGLIKRKTIAYGDALIGVCTIVYKTHRKLPNPSQ